MFSTKENYGRVSLNSYLPSQNAITHLNYYHSAGWHDCNQLYHKQYHQGLEGSLLILTTNGAGVLKLSGKEMTLLPNTLAIIPSGSDMEYYTNPQRKRWTFYWLTLDGIYVNNFCSYLYNYHGAVSEIPDMTSCMLQIKKLMTMDDYIHEWVISHWICLLLGTISEHLFGKTDTMDSNGSIAQRMVRYIEQHYAQQICLMEMSRKFYLSKNQLIRIFSAQTGYTPYEYLKRYRLLKACDLLQISDKSIQEVSSLTGFSTPSHFIAQFKKQYGVTPKIYRSQFSPICTT